MTKLEKLLVLILLILILLGIYREVIMPYLHIKTIGDSQPSLLILIRLPFLFLSKLRIKSDNTDLNNIIILVERTIYFIVLLFILFYFGIKWSCIMNNGQLIEEVYLIGWLVLLYPFIYFLFLNFGGSLKFPLTRVFILLLFIQINSSYYTNMGLYHKIMEKGGYYDNNSDIPFENHKSNTFLPFYSYLSIFNNKEMKNKELFLSEFLEFYNLEDLKRLDNGIIDRDEFKYLVWKKLDSISKERDSNYIKKDEIDFLRKKYEVKKEEILSYIKGIDTFYDTKERRDGLLKNLGDIDREYLRPIEHLIEHKGLKSFLVFLLKGSNSIKNKDEVIFTILQMIDKKGYIEENNDYFTDLSKLLQLFEPRTFTETEVIDSFKYLSYVGDFKDNLKLPLDSYNTIEKYSEFLTLYLLYLSSDLGISEEDKKRVSNYIIQQELKSGDINETLNLWSFYNPQRIFDKYKTFILLVSSNKKILKKYHIENLNEATYDFSLREKKTEVNTDKGRHILGLNNEEMVIPENELNSISYKERFVLTKKQIDWFEKNKDIYGHSVK